MRKTNLLRIVALALALLASVTWNSTAVAQVNQPVGIVIAYVPEQSITIMDQQGNQSEYVLDPSLRILPPGRANLLGVGSFVTVIAPASLSDGKQIAVGIVVHPHVPNGWTIPALSVTPFPTGTPISDTVTPTVTGTLPTETVTGTATETPPALETATLVETATPTPAVILTDTPTATPSVGGTGAPANTFIEWLRSLFRAVLSRE